MRQGQLIYIEHKTGQGDAGPAWIGRAVLSKSGRTVYFTGQAFKRSGGQGISGNYSCLETGDEYWISGVKREGADRHWAGHGPVMIDILVVEEYLEFRGLTDIDPHSFQVVSGIKDTDVSKFHDLENKTL